MNNYEKYTKAFQKTPKGKYITHRANSKRRDIPWEFTFETWWKMWEDSGKWAERGTGPKQYQMSRVWDEGPYSPTNVKIITAQENSRYACARRYHGWEKGPESAFKQEMYIIPIDKLLKI